LNVETMASTCDAIRLPTYSSSVPAKASGTIGAPVRNAISAAPWRNGPIRPAGPLTVPSGIWTKTARLRVTARAAATWLSTPMPPRQTGSSPPTRWISRSRQREVNVDGALPRNQHRGCTELTHQHTPCDPGKGNDVKRMST